MAEENKIIIKIGFALYRLLISNKMVARTTNNQINNDAI
ncbi:hypothetical protein BTURTLESOX_300 [bacterium endosymbiont of Bathymodiolus sp. 5 South]|nr:hypothetical protein BTURTLESOX_300 [bacterium endosymbiont of Bathymodiolus sp. 5 South]